MLPFDMIVSLLELKCVCVCVCVCHMQMWRENGHDMSMQSYVCVATGLNEYQSHVGLIEPILMASTTSEIHYVQI